MEEPDDDPEDDFIPPAWLGDFALSIRRDAVSRCMAGNDAQCFTTEQYQRAYDAIWKTTHGAIERLWASGLARRHLQSLSDVREVKPDVWTQDVLPRTEE